ncbi:hypothetical protein Tco_0224081 [Tanacetum coccineum]
MDDPNITIEEYIRLEEEKAQKYGKVFNWETAKYGKIWYEEDVHDLRSVKTEFPAIVFNDSLTSNEKLSCEPTVSSLNDEIDFRISFDESGDEDYTVVFDKNSFSYKIISTNDLKTDSENDNEKVNMPLFLSPEPSVSCIDDLDFFKDFENEFPVIVYNDALTSKSDFSTEPTLCPQHIDKFDLKDETSLSEYDEVEQSILYFNDLFPFNIVYPDDLKSDKVNDDNKVDMIQSSGGNENTNKLLKESHDKIRKVFIMRSFIMGLNIVAWNHFVNGILFNLIKNLYVPFSIPFDPKRYYKDGDCARMLWRPSQHNSPIRRITQTPIRRIESGYKSPTDTPYQAFTYTHFSLSHTKFYRKISWRIKLLLSIFVSFSSSTEDMAPLPPRDQRHLWLRYQVVGYTEEIVHDFEQSLDMIFSRQVNRVHMLDFEGLTPDMRQDLAERMKMIPEALSHIGASLELLSGISELTLT